MRLRLLPREEIFFDLFAQAAENVLLAAQLLQQLLDDYRDVQQRAEDIKKVEDRGDEIVHAVIDRVNRTFVTPLDREDILALIKQMDNVLDWIEATSARLALYGITTVTPEARELGRIVVNICQAIVEAVGSMRRLDQISGPVREINRLENLADHVQRDAMAKLFTDGTDPIGVIKWKEIYETLEEATDQGEDVADVLEGIRTKNL